jgi:hypothetical protein
VGGSAIVYNNNKALDDCMVNLNEIAGGLRVRQRQPVNPVIYGTLDDWVPELTLGNREIEQSQCE